MYKKPKEMKLFDKVGWGGKILVSWKFSLEQKFYNVFSFRIGNSVARERAVQYFLCFETFQG